MLPISIKDLAAKSGDSILDFYEFRNGALRIDLKVDELDIDLRIHILTHVVRAIEIPSGFRATCRIELTELENNLGTQNGFYIPSSDFGKMMNEAKLGLSYAYGEKSQEVKWLFTLVGFRPLISCLVKDLQDITWQPYE